MKTVEFGVYWFICLLVYCSRGYPTSNIKPLTSIIFGLLFVIPIQLFSQSKDTMHNSYSYLALGDSYTIGEAVQIHQNFPYQVVQILRKKGFNFQAPEIIARTGWTTDE